MISKTYATQLGLLMKHQWKRNFRNYPSVCLLVGRLVCYNFVKWQGGKLHFHDAPIVALVGSETSL